VISYFRRGWSTEGVTTIGINDSFVQCKSSHLTSFAVLVGASGTDVCISNSIKFIIITLLLQEEALSFISYIGCGISIVCLILTIGALVLLRYTLI